MLRNIVIAVLAVALVGAVAWGAWLSWRMDSLSADNTALRLAVQACDARNQNIEEDRERDATVFDPDFDVPSWWMLPQP